MQRVITSQLELENWKEAQTKFPVLLANAACDVAMLAGPIPWKVVKQESKRKAKWGDLKQRLRFEFDHLPPAIQGLINECRLKHKAADAAEAPSAWKWETFTMPGIL